MRLGTVVILVLLAVGLGSLLWFFERDLPSTDERVERSKKILQLEMDEIEAVDIELGGGAGVRIERARVDEDDEGSAGEWRLIRPLVARADADRVASLLRAVTTLPKSRELGEVPEADVGLSPPRARVSLEAEGQVWRLSVGADVPASSNLIVGLDSGKVFVTTRSLWIEVDRAVDDWRAREVLPVDRDEIERIAVSSGSTDLVLSRDGDRFRIEEPMADAADEDKTTALLGALQELTVEEFLDEPPAHVQLGLGPAALTLKLDITNREQPFEIQLGALVADDDDLRYGEAEGQMFTAETELPEILAAPIEDWQSKAWTSLETFELDGVRIADEEGPLLLTRDEGKWLRDGEEIPYSAASDFVYALVELRGQRIRPMDETGRRGPASVLKLELEAADAVESLRLAAREEGGYVATREGRAFELEVATENVESLLQALSKMREAEAPPPAVDAAAD